MPKVSVVIPTYNRAQYLKRAVDSVLNQSFQDFEIIIVDDASTDDTSGVVSGLHDSRIRYIRHETNRREAGSRNTGVQHSTGEYIAFLDDDDSWLSHKLAAQVDLLARSPSTVGLVYSSFFITDWETGKILDAWNAEKRGNVFWDLSEQNWVGIPSTVMVRRQCFTTAGMFDEQVEFGLDYDMWIRIARAYEFEFLEEPLAYRAVNHARLSTDYKLLLKGAQSTLRKHGEYFMSNRRAYGRRLLGMGVLYCFDDQLSQGRAMFLKSIRANPFELRSYYNLILSSLGVKTYKRIKNLRDKIASRPLYRVVE